MLPGDQEGRYQSRTPGGHLGRKLGRDCEAVLYRVNAGGHGQRCPAERERVRGYRNALPVRLVDESVDLLLGPYQRAVRILPIARGRIKALAHIDLQAVDAISDLGSDRLTACSGAGAAVNADRERHAVALARERIAAG